MKRYKKNWADIRIRIDFGRLDPEPGGKKRMLDFLF
jgi:hypothetical protein